MSRLRRLIGRLVWPDAAVHRRAERVVCHEWLAIVGGSDKVAVELADVAGAEVIYTFALTDECVEAVAPGCPVVTWRFGRWAGRSARFKVLLPIMPAVWWALDLTAADLVVTSSHSCVNAIRTPDARRVSYCHTPMRYAWEWRLERERLPPLGRPLMPVGAAVLRWFDRRWSRRVDDYIANSTFVASRIRRAYERQAAVIPPPVAVDRFVPPDDPGPRMRAPLITAGRLVPYKRFDLAVSAATRAGRDLIVAGDGPELARLRSIAGPTVTFVPNPDDDELAALLGGARAFLFCGIEDFGMLPVEAQACGTPVIARRSGGALDSVVEHVTGTFVDDDAIDQWADAIESFEPDRFDAAAIRRHAERFGPTVFRQRIADLLAVTGRNPAGKSDRSGARHLRMHRPARSGSWRTRIGLDREDNQHGASDPENDLAAGDAETTTTLLIAATPRSGSNMLCSLLTSTGVAGRPTEYLQPPALSQFSRRWGVPKARPKARLGQTKRLLLGRQRWWSHRWWYSDSVAEYIGKLAAHRTSPNGVFGIKLFPSQLGLLREVWGLDLDVFPGDHVWVHLRRDDVVGQAISYYRAGNTQEWVVTDARDVEPPEYDGEQILEQIRFFDAGNEQWRREFERLGIEPLELEYSELVGDPDGSVRRVLEVLGAEPGETIVTETKRQADATNQEMRSRFLADYPEYADRSIVP